MYFVRLCWLEETYDELDALLELYESHSTTELAASQELSLSRFVLSLWKTLTFRTQPLIFIEGLNGWQPSDGTMVDLACKQTARTALKLRNLDKKYLDDSQLAYIHTLVHKVNSKIEDLEQYSTSVNQLTNFSGKPSTEFRPFKGFELLLDNRHTDAYSGYETEAPPEMYVNLMDPKKKPTTFKEVLDLLQATITRCSKLRSKIAVSSSSLVMYQAYSLVEHFVVSFLPLPSADPNDLHDLWRAAKVTKQEQHQCLLALYLLSQHYLTASFSLTQDSALLSARILVQLTIFACFDAVIRLVPTDAVSPVTLALHGYDPYSVFPLPPAAPKPTPYLPHVNSMSSVSLSDIASRMVLVEPSLLVLRDKVFTYWKSVVRRLTIDHHFWVFFLILSLGGCSYKD